MNQITNEVVQKFSDWSNLKIKIHNETSRPRYFDEGQMWWVSVGQNIGVESNGKGKNYERPVIILKRFNNKSLLVVFLSSQSKTGEYYFPLSNGISVVNLSQIRLISSKRLIRKIGDVPELDFNTIKNKIKAYLN